MKTQYLTLVVLVFFYSQVHAENLANRSISRLAVYKTYAIVAFTPAGTNEKYCVSKLAKNSARINLSTSGGKFLLSMAQALYVSKSSKVSLGLGNCGAGDLSDIYRVEGK